MPYTPERRPVRNAPRLARHFDGARLELVELTFGPQFLIAVGVRTRGDNAGLALLAGALQVDGHPIGLEELQALPARLGPELNALMLECMQMHAADDDEAPPDASANDEGGAPPGESSTRSA